MTARTFAKAGRRAQVKSMSEVAADPYLWRSWHQWHERIMRAERKVYGSRNNCKNQNIGLDLFGTSETAAASREACHGDLMQVRVLKEAARAYHDAKDPRLRAAMMKTMESCAKEVDKMMATHFDDIPRLFLQIRRLDMKEAEIKLEHERIGTEGDAIEAELLDMLDGNQEKLDRLKKEAGVNS